MQTIPAMPANPADLRCVNRAQVIRAFQGGRLCSAGEVAEQVGLSRQTVMKAIQFFLRTGLLTSAGKGTSTSLGGKRPELFELTRQRYFLCITVWPEYLRIHLATVGGIAVADLVREEPLPRDPEEAMARIGRQAVQLIRRSGVDPERVKAVSVSTAGIMDYATGTLRYSSQSPDWGTDVPVADLLRHWFPPDTIFFVENTGKMTARPFLLEQQLQTKRVAVIFSCWGLSGCLIEAGHILSGGNSLIGEIGHMTIDPEDTEVCGCGSRGCLERLVSAERLGELARRWAGEHPESELAAAEPLTLPAVFEASARGDSLARALTAYLARHLAVALRNISLVFDPDVVVFQGDYAHADDHFRQMLLAHIAQLQYFPAGGPFELRFDRRRLTDMDTAGAVIALSQQYFDRPELYEE